MLLKILFLLILLLERGKNSSWLTSNRSNGLVMAEKAYGNWVNMHASLKHPVFRNANNKFKTCQTIKLCWFLRMGQSGRPLGTYASATFAVNSPYFIAKTITFKNKAPSLPSGALGKQAVTLRTSADTAAFIGCKLVGGLEHKTLFMITWGDEVDTTSRTTKRLPFACYKQQLWSRDSPEERELAPGNRLLLCQLQDHRLRHTLLGQGMDQ